MAGCRLGLRKRLALGLFADLYREKVAEHRLDTLFWECTLRCNLNCRHCGSDCRSDARTADMPLADFLRVLDEEVTPHVNPREVLIIFSGGEVLMRSDLEEAGREVTRRGYPWGMVTNGLALDEERLARLVDAGLRTVSVSLDGFEQEHNAMRRHPKSFERALAAIRAIRRYPELAFDVVTCVTGAMVHRLPEMAEMLLGEGVREWRLFSIFPMGRAKEDRSLQLTSEEFRTMLDFIRTMRKTKRMEVSYACEGFLGEYEAEVRDHFYQCAAGVSVASIRVDGAISGCTSIRADYHQGNIYHDRFWEVWEQRFEPFRNREWMRQGACAACKMFRYCQGGGMHLRDEQGELLYCHYRKLYEEK
ncbi:MAG: TIGR04133 family radical SAM/SPASM protein [Alistipes sp.]|nr:TIGR04133 family radical SAM/SPASM protein [Alistipes sp.]